MKKRLNKKAQGALAMLTTGAIAVLIAIITVAIALQINTSMGDAISVSACGTNSTPLNITGDNAAYSIPTLCSDAVGGIDNNWTCVCAEWNATSDGTTGLATFGNYWVSIISIIILVVIVGLFVFFRGGTGGIEIR